MTIPGPQQPAKPPAPKPPPAGKGYLTLTPAGGASSPKGGQQPSPAAGEPPGNVVKIKRAQPAKWQLNQPAGAAGQQRAASKATAAKPAAAEHLTVGHI